jgi:hypothetical protein
MIKTYFHRRGGDIKLYMEWPDFIKLIDRVNGCIRTEINQGIESRSILMYILMNMGHSAQSLSSYPLCEYNLPLPQSSILNRPPYGAATKATHCPRIASLPRHHLQQIGALALQLVTTTTSHPTIHPSIHPSPEVARLVLLFQITHQAHKGTKNKGQLRLVQKRSSE